MIPVKDMYAVISEPNVRSFFEVKGLDKNYMYVVDVDRIRNIPFNHDSIIEIINWHETRRVLDNVLSDIDEDMGCIEDYYDELLARDVVVDCYVMQSYTSEELDD